MKTSKTTVIGLLVCLTCLYLMNEVWLMDGVLEVLPVLGAYGFPIGVIATLIGLFKKGQD
ncbi:MAG TPA: hypothetical protein GX016_00765 [Firmicutes bacterium]|nr:hypothetical protein [Bacillota bacterium]